MAEKTRERDDADWIDMVRCPPMRTYVPLAFCLNGGPMKAKGKCKYLVQIRSTPSSKPGQPPIREVIHNYPKTDVVERHVRMTGDPKDDNDI